MGLFPGSSRGWGPHLPCKGFSPCRNCDGEPFQNEVPSHLYQSRRQEGQWLICTMEGRTMGGGGGSSQTMGSDTRGERW